MRRLPSAVLCTVLLLAACSGPGLREGNPPASLAGAGSASIHAHRVAGGLTFPAAFTFAPDGRIFYAERFSGEIRILDLKSHSDHLFFRVSSVGGAGEQGLIGLALHPSWPKRPFVYAYATRNTSNGERNQILRIKSDHGRGADARVIFTSSTVAGTYHDGGRILFGPDHMLYAVVGEGHASSNAQELNSTGGKILRITPSGGPAPGNPFSSKVFAYGIRNSFGFDFDPKTGVLWETEAGPECNDELNDILKGRNYGWGPHETCSSPPVAPRNTNQDGPNPVLPQRFYNPIITPTGAVFCHGCHLGKANNGKLFFGAYNTGQIRKVKLGPDRKNVASQTVVVSHGSGILSMEAAPNGRIYFSDETGIFRLERA